MPTWVSLASGLSLLAVVACSSVEVIRPPAREADLYPDAEERSGVVVAVDAISDPGRVQRYFDAPLLDEGILPVQIVVSNRSNHRIQVRPSDVLLLRGKRVIDPVPIERVIERMLRHHLVTSETAEQIHTFFGNVSFRHAVVAPASSYQGILFFPTMPKEKRRSRYFRLVSLFLEPTLWLRVAATDLDTHDRIHFGPFGLAP